MALAVRVGSGGGFFKKQKNPGEPKEVNTLTKKTLSMNGELGLFVCLFVFGRMAFLLYT